MSEELVRYHQVLDETLGDPEAVDRLRAAVSAVERELGAASVDGPGASGPTVSDPGVSSLGSSVPEVPALPQTPQTRPGLEGLRVQQIPYGRGDDDDEDIVDAELVADGEDRTSDGYR